MTVKRKVDLRRGKRTLLFLILLLALPFLSQSAFAQWSTASLPTVSSNWQLFSVRFLSSNEGWAVGRDSSNKTGVILHFSNGSWASVPVPEVSFDWELIGLHFISSSEGWAVGKDSLNRRGVILHFSNGSWTLVSAPTVSLDWELDSVHFTSPDAGWAVGKDSSSKSGVILFFSNGFWSYVFPPDASSDWELLGVHFTSSGEGWAVGTDNSDLSGILLHYTDNAWTSVTPPNVSSQWWLYGVQFTSSSEGWAVGMDFTNHRGVLLHYSGGSWTSVTPPAVSSDWGLWDVSFISGTEGWAVGHDFFNNSGALLHYLNTSWTSVLPPAVSSDWQLWGVDMISSMEGWAVGQSSDGTNVGGVSLKYGRPSISVSPVNLDYREVALGAFLDKIVTVTNKGNSTLLINAVTSPSLPFLKHTDGCSGRSVSPQGSCKITYRFSPAVEGDFTSTSDIPSNDPDKSLVTLNLSGTGFVGPPLYIHLLSPVDGQGFDACSYYDPPTFQWDPSETFKSIEIQFSPQDDFSLVSAKATGKQASELTISSSLWKKVLLIPGKMGGKAYWKVVGTRTDKTKVESNVFSLDIEGAKMVTDVNISSTSRTGPPPILSWENNCNTRFKVGFSKDPDFKKKTTLSFKTKNPTDSGGKFEATLSSNQWNSIRKLVGDISGSTLYWYVESWDSLNRSAKTETMTFVITD